MLTLPHVLVALVIIKRFPHPAALLLALASHFILDFCTPHWNPHLYTEFHQQGRVSSQSIKIAFIDGLIAVAITIFFILKALPNLYLASLTALAAGLAVLPDLIEVPYYFLGFKDGWLKDYVRFEHQYQAKANIFWGNLTQILVILACLSVLF